MNITSQNQWLFVSDVDDTLLGDENALIDLADALQLGRNSLIIAYNSSRPCASLFKTLETIPHIPHPDYLIGGMGTEIQEVKTEKLLTEYTQQLRKDWEYHRITAIMDNMGYQAHPQEFQTFFKASYDIPDVASYKKILHCLQAASLKAKTIYSGGKNLDIIPCNGGKGNALEYFRQQLGIPPQHVIVAGDSENDLEMLVAPYRCIIVANATRPLKQLTGDYIYHTSLPYAGGILEGLRFWKILPISNSHPFTLPAVSPSTRYF